MKAKEQAAANPGEKTLKSSINATTRRAIRDRLGIEPPREFMKLLAVACKYSNRPANVPTSLYAVLGHYLAGPWLTPLGVRGETFSATTYCNWPPELVPILSLGCDGQHAGFVVSTPELRAKDYPLASFCPMDSDGAIYEGADFASGLARLIAQNLHFASEYRGLSPADQPMLDDLIRSLALKLPGPKTMFAVRWSRVVPPGYSYLPTPDRLGVIAPAETIRPLRIPLSSNKLTADLAIEYAKRVAARGLFGSALCVLKHAYWHHGAGADGVRLALAMARSYEQLNRPMFAAIVRAQARSWRK